MPGGGRSKRQAQCKREPESESSSSNGKKMSLRRYRSDETELLEIPQKRKRTPKKPSEENAVAGTSTLEEVIHPHPRDRCNLTPEAFQEIMNDRKAEKERLAEEKREELLQRLHDRDNNNSTSVWDVILQQLGMNKEKRSKFQSQQSNPPYGNMENVRVRLPSDNLKLLMSVRHLSNTLRDRVDNYIETHLLQTLRNTTESSEQLYTVSLKFPKDSASAQLQKILSFSEGPITKRPKRLFTRSLEITVDGATLNPNYNRDTETNKKNFRKNLPVFLKNISALLGSVGDQLLHFKISFHNLTQLMQNELGISRIYDILREWLGLMPKVKWLELEVVKLGTLAKSNSEENSIVMATINNALQNVMPTLYELERLDCTSCKEIPIWNPVIKANPHVKFHEQYGQGNRENFTDVQTDHTDPLVLSLALEAVDIGEKRNQERVSPWDLSMLKKITENKWNLKKMLLAMDIKDYKDDPIPIDSVFRCVQQSFPTLEDFSMTINHLQIEKEINFLRLPNLKKFSLEFGPIVSKSLSEESHFFYSLQFLIHCSKLEKLTWKNLINDSTNTRNRMERVGESKGVMIGFKGGQVDLCASNVWNVFPHLAYVYVQYSEGGTAKERKCRMREYRDRKLVGKSDRKWHSSNEVDKVRSLDRCRSFLLDDDQYFDSDSDDDDSDCVDSDSGEPDSGDSDSDSD